MPDEEGHPRIHQLYDAAMRWWAESHLAAVAGWLDPSVAGLPAGAFVPQPTSFTVPVIHADLLLTAGPGRLMHVEYETRPDAGLVGRMYDYRGRIMRQHPGMRLGQFVIVLGEGHVRGHDDLATTGFALDLQVIHLREHAPADFLADPVLAPFAALARGSRREREASLGAAIRLLRDSGHPHTAELVKVTEALARIRLNEATISRIRRENAMDLKPLLDWFRDDDWAVHFREEGREEGRERLLLAMLRARFGDSPDARAAASHLAGWDEESAVGAIAGAADPASLLRLHVRAGSDESRHG